MSILINNNKFTKVYFGGDNISKIYKGKDLVFQLSSDSGGDDFDGQIQLTLAKSVSSGSELFRYRVSSNSISIYTATKDYSKGDVLTINDLPDMLSQFAFVEDVCSRIAFSSKINILNDAYMGYMFSGCAELTSLDVSHFDTSQVTNMGSMFEKCTELTSLDVSNFNTTSVTTMNYMFNECASLTSLDVSNFNTTSVMYMRYMFNRCYKLTSLNLSHFNTSKVTDMSYMFQDCRSLTSLDVSKFNTTSVTNMKWMLSGLYTLSSLDVSNFNTTSVTDMGYMFYEDYALTSLDVSNFDTSSVTNMGSMFLYCTKLKNIIFGPSWGKNTASLILNLSSYTNSDNKYQFTDETWNSMLNMYDRASNGLSSMNISIKSTSNVPDGWTKKMTAKGYSISLN